MYRRIVPGLLFSLLVLCTWTGCSPSFNKVPIPYQKTEQNDRDSGNNVKSLDNNDQDEETLTVMISLYFGDKDAIEANTPGSTGFVKLLYRQYPDTRGVLRLALEELIKGPHPEEGNLSPTLPATTRIIDVRIENKIAVISFSEEVVTDPGAPGGSLAGGIFVQSIVYTATQFPTVDAALVKVNGEPWSDGHFTWDKPVSRENLNL